MQESRDGLGELHVSFVDDVNLQSTEQPTAAGLRAGFGQDSSVDVGQATPVTQPPQTTRFDER